MSESSGAAAGATAAAAAPSAATGGEGQAQAAEAAVSQAPSVKESVGAEAQQVDAAEPEVQQEAQPEPAKEKETVEPYKPTHKYFDNLKESYPDREFNSDDDVDSAFDEYMNDHVQYRKRGDQANKQLNDFFESEPQVMEAVRESINDGVPFNVALAKHFSPEDFTLNEGDDRYADFDANRKSRDEKLAQKRERTETFDKNFKESVTTLETFMKEEGMDLETKNDMMTKYDEMMQEMFSGKITQDTLRGIQRMVQFEQAVADATETGEIKGKNQNITAKMATESKPKGDGVPALKSGGEVKEAPKQTSPIDSIVDYANSKDPFRDDN